MEYIFKIDDYEGVGRGCGVFKAKKHGMLRPATAKEVFTLK